MTMGAIISASFSSLKTDPRVMSLNWLSSTIPRLLVNASQNGPKRLQVNALPYFNVHVNVLHIPKAALPLEERSERCRRRGAGDVLKLIYVKVYELLHRDLQLR